MKIDPQRLLSEDSTAWDELLDAVVAGTAPDAPEVASVLLERTPDFGHWVRFAQQRLEASDKHFTIGGPLGKFRAWFGEQALATMDRHGPRAWPIRLELIQRVAADDGGLADATELMRDMEDGLASDEELAEVSLLIVKGAFTARDYGVARKYAMEAMKLYQAMDDAAGVNFAQRRLAAGLLYLGEVELAMQMFARALTTRGPLFGGGGVQVFTRAPDPKTEAIDEARDISAWAELTTPEWVRAVGGLALRWDDEDEAELLWRTFDTLLDQMMESSNIYSDIEVVVRQASQRNHLAVAERALRRYLEDFPDDEWATAYVRDIGRA